MKSNFLDKLIGFISPEAEMKRIRARGKTELLKRSYDAAQTFQTDDWRSASKGSANNEIRGAQSTLRAKGRDAVRNNPLAVRALSTIVANTVGSGIVPNIQAKSKLRTKQLNDAWKEWAETSLCDSTGRHNFYAIQALAMRSIVESGEIVLLKEVSDNNYTVRVLESDYINSSVDTTRVNLNGDTVIQGVRIDSRGRVKSIYIYKQHPGDSISSTEYLEIPVERLSHAFKQDRPDQLRGVSWFHPVLRQLADFNEYQQATLINRKVSACFTAFITTSNQDSTLSASDIKAKREAENMLGPAQMRYLDAGESMQLAAPPPVTGYDEYCRQVQRLISAGLNVPYSALTNDFSQFNFSSTKMERNEFKTNVDMWRWQMLIPQVCEPAFAHFLKWCSNVKAIPVDGVTCEWVPPAWMMIDPTKEIPAMESALRSGLTSRPKAVLELGYDPKQLNEEIAESNKELDELGIILDSDPRKTTKAGLFQVVQSASSTQGNQIDVQNNQEDLNNGSASVGN